MMAFVYCHRNSLYQSLLDLSLIYCVCVCSCVWVCFGRGGGRGVGWGGREEWEDVYTCNGVAHCPHVKRRGRGMKGAGGQ